MSVKPHASPVFHAIQYLLGNLDRAYLPTLRAFGGLQSYPSRTKDPDTVDFSTGSVGLGAAAPLFAAAARRYVDAHFGARPRSRFVALIGDAELDEGNIWEAVSDPATDGLGNVMWIVDVNRQRLDRVVPGIRIAQWEQQFTRRRMACGRGQVRRPAAGGVRAPGRRSRCAPGSTRCPTSITSRCSALPRRPSGSGFSTARPDEVRGSAPGSPTTTSAPAWSPIWPAMTSRSLLEAFGECDREKDRPSVVFAYTVKGWGLPIAGNPLNHSALLSTAQIDADARAAGLTPATEWDRLDPMTTAGQWVAARARAPGPRAAAELAGRGRARFLRRCAPAGRSPPRRRSAGSWSACPATRPWRRSSSPPRRTSPSPPTWPA